MSALDNPLRSPELMSADDTVLLVIDVQEKLMRLLPRRRRIIWNIRRLIDAARVLDVSVLATEQYPQGLGGTEPELASRLGPSPAKLGFSCASCPEVMGSIESSGVLKVLAVGIEAHVCVQQTVLDLLSASYRVYVAVDAVGSRSAIDCDTALRRMDSSGATLTTAESAMFEWCQAAGTPRFKAISALVRETPPEEESEG
jgi:nicotinamidase-related amidase